MDRFDKLLTKFNAMKESNEAAKRAEIEDKRERIAERMANARAAKKKWPVTIPSFIDQNEARKIFEHPGTVSEKVDYFKLSRKAIVRIEKFFEEENG
jgi:DNA invertase Pin-like site-specific DNA recombinase